MNVMKKQCNSFSRPIGTAFCSPPRRQTVCWSKDKAGVENSETHRYRFNTFPILSGQLELEWGGGGGDGGGTLNWEELKSKKALEEKKEEKLSAKSARMEGRNHGYWKYFTKNGRKSQNSKNLLPRQYDMKAS